MTSVKEDRLLSVGVDIGGTKISMGLVTPLGETMDLLELPTGPDYSYKAVGNKITESILIILKNNGIQIKELAAIGFGIPGTTNSEKGIIAHAPNLGWKNVPFGAFMQEKLDSNLYFVQETHAAVLAEYLFGAGRGCKNLACVAIGTGIGCGLIINGMLHRGSFNTAGEFGHLIVVKGGNECACGRRGCLESYGSGTSIQRILTDGSISSAKGKTTEELFQLAMDGDEEIRTAIIGLVEYIGMGLVSLINLFSPEKVLLTGGLADQRDLVVEVLKKYVRNNAYDIAADRVIIDSAALGKNTPMIGAAMLYKSIKPYRFHEEGTAVYG